MEMYNLKIDMSYVMTETEKEGDLLLKTDFRCNFEK